MSDNLFLEDLWVDDNSGTLNFERKFSKKRKMSFKDPAQKI